MLFLFMSFITSFLCFTLTVMALVNFHFSRSTFLLCFLIHNSAIFSYVFCYLRYIFPNSSIFFLLLRLVMTASILTISKFNGVKLWNRLSYRVESISVAHGDISARQRVEVQGSCGNCYDGGLNGWLAAIIVGSFQSINIWRRT